MAPSTDKEPILLAGNAAFFDNMDGVDPTFYPIPITDDPSFSEQNTSTPYFDEETILSDATSAYSSPHHDEQEDGHSLLATDSSLFYFDHNNPHQHIQI